MTTALIGLDWGTSTLRVYRLAADGTLLGRREAAAGILQIGNGAFEVAFQRAVGDWLAAAPAVPVLASGMITSRQGWVEVPYLTCPADLAGLAQALHPHDTVGGRRVWFVPGLSHINEDGVPDVIRGEETQIAGVLPGASDPALMVLPGTHSKWVRTEGGRIVAFATFMTGEVFAVLKAHSILGRLMTSDAHDAAAFERGLAYAGDRGRGLLGRLFSARSLGLFDRLAGDDLASYLSGLLIGTEIEEAMSWSRGYTEVTVIGGSVLAERYSEALAWKGARPIQAPTDVAATGLLALARQAGLVE